MIDFVSLSNVIIDDILLPYGRAIFGVLGGAVSMQWRVHGSGLPRWD
jgi:hypothetical protein